ncbi:MAG: hypothetical protein JJV97_01955 [SAR324 cluster bacterium]|nr:hypothetical protein [SAR324 cluster bacterium]
MKIFVFDVDGVVLDYKSGYSDFLADKQGNIVGKNDPALPLPKCSEWDFINSTKFGKLQPLIAPEKFNHLCSDGKVFFVTNLPPKIKSIRIDNLRKLGFEFKEVLTAGFETYGEREYPTKGEVLLKIVGKHQHFLFVDDYYENCDEIALQFSHAKVFMLKGAHDFHKSTSRFEKVENWQILEKRIVSIKNESNKADN